MDLFIHEEIKVCGNNLRRELPDNDQTRQWIVPRDHLELIPYFDPVLAVIPVVPAVAINPIPKSTVVIPGTFWPEDLSVYAIIDDSPINIREIPDVLSRPPRLVNDKIGELREELEMACPGIAVSGVPRDIIYAQDDLLSGILQDR